MRKRTDDLADLIKVATDALAVALGDGDTNHPAGSWMDETTGNQFNHLAGHFKAIQTGAEGLNAKEDHLAHLICRAVMARAIHLKSRV